MKIRALAACSVLLFGAAACGGGDDDDTATAGTDATTTTVASDTPADAPQHIVSLAPSLTEMLYAIGAGDQVVAVDDQSDYPDGVPTTDLSGYTPNVEAIATYDPDLVVGSDLPDDIQSGLQALDVDVVSVSAATTLDDTYAQLEQLGETTGHADEAADVIDDMKTQIQELADSVPDRDVAPTYYHELDDTLFSVTSNTFIGQLYSLAGLQNVADPADADGQSGGYPQLSAEFLVDADPDYVFLADTECCGQDATTFAARPGFADLNAIANDHVVTLDDDIASRWGPRVVDLLRTIIEATNG
jgi:iron complex transport system substrate-binding protein